MLTLKGATSEWRRRSVAAPPPLECYTTEFRAYKDDAWYSVCVLLEGDALRVKYQSFSDEYDDVFEASHFWNSEELEDLRERFRPVSRQLQDDECRRLARGATVCASYSFSNDDVRFYDALVDGVQENKHSWKTGEEECLCTFLLFWLHGPNARNLTTASVENICEVQRWELDPAVASFLEMTREKIQLFSSRVLVSTGVSGFEMVPYGNKSSNTTLRMNYFEQMEKEAQYAKKSVVNVCSPKVDCLDRRMEDMDLKGTKDVCMILITNIDKELCPSTIIEFLQIHTSVSARVFIFPSFSMELYTRGAIMVDSKKEFQELCDFLNNPNCIVTSSIGRPWVTLEKVVGFKKIKASIGALVHISEERKRGTINNLKVVHSGTKEFKIASNMRDLFLAFSEHQERLHKRLALEERRISAAASEQLICKYNQEEGGMLR